VIARAARTALVLVAVTLTTSAGVAEAHDRSVSYSTWKIDEAGASVRVKVSRLDLTRLALDPFNSLEDADRAARTLSKRVLLFAGDELCPPTRDASMLTPGADQRESGWLIFAWSVSCPVSGIHTIESTFLLEVAPSHLHFARVHLAGSEGGQPVRVLSEAEPRWTLSDAGTGDPQGATSITGYLLLGIEHILSGWDHLAFVFALLLLAGSLREVAGLVTGFTIAHSVTLGLATLGILQPDSAGVEALIGLSIALVAAENAWILAGRRRALPVGVGAALVALAAVAGSLSGSVMLLGVALFTVCHFELLRRSARPARLRVALAFAFGLIHGFGFAGVLSEFSLDPGSVVPALFGFNLGVEVGQLAVVLLVWPLLRGIARLPARSAESRDWGRLTAEVGSAGVCGLGLFWFVTRQFG
jgi:hypothetical protein